MKIAFDAALLSRPATGIADITISIINAFVRNYPDDEFYLLINGPIDPEISKKLPSGDNVRIIQKQLPFLKSVNLLWSLFCLNFMIKRIDPDIFIEPNFLLNTIGFPARTKLIVYIHDVVFKERPQTMKAITRIYMRCFFLSSLKRANLIWTNSHYTKERLQRYYDSILRSKRLFVGAGVNPYFLKRSTMVKNSGMPFIVNGVEINFRYLLFVGTMEPRKNFPFLLKLLMELKDENYQLLVVGAQGWGNVSEEISDLLDNSAFLRKQISFLGYVETDQLIALYKNAYAFISTSLNEGLGLPQLEAMSCGCPVISPHNSAMAEIVYNTGITVSGWELSDWKDAIREIGGNRAQFIEKGFLKVQHLDWNTIVNEIYQKHLLDFQRVK